MPENETNKGHPISDLEIKVIMRDQNKKLKAEKILTAPSQSVLLNSLCVVAAALLASYMLRGFFAPDLTGALLVGTFAGLIGTRVQLWYVQRRLEALIELTKFHEFQKNHE